MGQLIVTEFISLDRRHRLPGRRSHEIFTPVWPQMEECAGYNAMPTYVVSTTGADTPLWPDEDQGKTRLTLAEHATYSSGVQLQVWDVVR